MVVSSYSRWSLTPRSPSSECDALVSCTSTRMWVARRFASASSPASYASADRRRKVTCSRSSRSRSSLVWLYATLPSCLTEQTRARVLHPLLVARPPVFEESLGRDVLPEQTLHIRR